jgi:DegV family protein with EDD domain
MVKIVTDSTAYLKKDEAEALSVKVIPVTYSKNGRSYYESYSDNNGNFESLLKSNAKFTTSQPNTEAFLSAFEEELSQGNEVLCITISSRLSGTYSAAYMAAKQTGSKSIVVFDSHLSAGGLYLLISEARKLLDLGKTLQETAGCLVKIRDRISVAFSVDDMTPLQRSGRIGFVRANVRTILNIRPILLCRDGAVVFDSVARGNMETIKKLADKIPPEAVEAVINYIENSRTASNLYTVIKERRPHLPIKLRKMGPVLGIHLGLQVVAVSSIVSD